MGIGSLGRRSLSTLNSVLLSLDLLTHYVLVLTSKIYQAWH